jgi:hypothetical protein
MQAQKRMQTKEHRGLKKYLRDTFQTS